MCVRDSLVVTNQDIRKVLLLGRGVLLLVSLVVVMAN